MVPLVGNNTAHVDNKASIKFNPKAVAELVASSLPPGYTVDSVTISKETRNSGKGKPVITEVEVAVADKDGDLFFIRQTTHEVEEASGRDLRKYSDQGLRHESKSIEEKSKEVVVRYGKLSAEQKRDVDPFIARLIKAKNVFTYKITETIGDQGRDIAITGEIVCSVAATSDTLTGLSDEILESPGASEQTKSELKESAEVTLVLNQALADKCAELGIANPFSAEKAAINENNDYYDGTFFGNLQNKLNALLQDLRSEISRVMNSDAAEDKVLDEKRAKEKSLAKKRELRKLEEKAQMVSMQLNSIEFEKDPEAAKKKLAAVSAEITKLARQYLDIRGDLSKADRIPLDLAFKKLLSVVKIEKQKLSSV